MASFLQAFSLLCLEQNFQGTGASMLRKAYHLNTLYL